MKKIGSVEKENKENLKTIIEDHWPEHKDQQQDANDFLTECLDDMDYKGIEETTEFRCNNCNKEWISKPVAGKCAYYISPNDKINPW